MKETEIRYRTEPHELAFRQQIRIWWEDVVLAISDLWGTLRSWPDKHYVTYVEMHPGEPGYDEAPYETYWLDSQPARFDFKDGEWVRRETESQ